MRPVRLELDGFGSFRQPSTVDFTDADFFALVGPTGAGKSTVVDAIVFALYGSVPRWDDRRAVGWALAPTANRGVVTLAFDVGADRYVAARELRRSAQGRVTVQQRPAGARRRRCSPPTARSAARWRSCSGSPYDHFVRCVILPQGDFARFLHSSPKERQDTLVDLLGIRIYRGGGDPGPGGGGRGPAARRLRRAPAGRVRGRDPGGGGRGGRPDRGDRRGRCRGGAGGCPSWSRRPRR